MLGGGLLLLWMAVSCAELDAAISPKVVVAPEEARLSPVEAPTKKGEPISTPLPRSRIVVLSNSMQTQIWIEGSKPLLFKGRPKLYWHELGFIVYVEKERLYRYYDADGFLYYSPMLTALAKPFEEVEQKPIDVTWESKTRYKKRRWTPVVSGAPALRVMKKKSVSVELPTVSHRKKTIVDPERLASMTWATKSAAPENSTVLSLRRADPLLKTAWLSDLRGLTGERAKIESDRMIDLDRDGQDEAIVVISGSKGRLGFIFDKQAGIRRYVSIPPIARSVAFTHESGVYIGSAVRSKNKKKKRALLYFDGVYRYETRPLSDL